MVTYDVVFSNGYSIQFEGVICFIALRNLKGHLSFRGDKLERNLLDVSEVESVVYYLYNTANVDYVLDVISVAGIAEHCKYDGTDNSVTVSVKGLSGQKLLTILTFIRYHIEECQQMDLFNLCRGEGLTVNQAFLMASAFKYSTIRNSTTVGAGNGGHTCGLTRDCKAWPKDALLSFWKGGALPDCESKYTDDYRVASVTCVDNIFGIPRSGALVDQNDRGLAKSVDFLKKVIGA